MSNCETIKYTGMFMENIAVNAPAHIILVYLLHCEVYKSDNAFGGHLFYSCQEIMLFRNQQTR